MFTIVALGANASRIRVACLSIAALFSILGGRVAEEGQNFHFLGL